jgi:hypothetical protein
MKRFYILFLTSYILLLILSACSSYHVIHITDSNKENVLNKPGFYYSLPQTVLKVDVTVRKTYLNKGPYAEYAEKYLGITNIIKQDNVRYDILDARISSFPQRDPDQCYFVRKSPGFRMHRHLFVNFNEEGSIQSVNCRLKSGASERNVSVNTQSELKSGNNSQYILSDNVNEKIDTIIEKIRTDTLVIEKKIFKKVYKEKSSEEKAKEAADYLMKIKDNKFNLITGYAEVPYTKDALKYMNDKLDNTSHEYLSLFTGDTSYIVVKYSFIYLPEKKDINIESPLFVFSPREGIIKTNEAQGENVTVSIESRNLNNRIEKFQSKIDSSISKKNGFYYRIPEYAKITLKKGKNMLTEEDLLINQLGIVSHLPLKAKKIQFYPNSSALRFIAE